MTDEESDKRHRKTAQPDNRRAEGDTKGITESRAWRNIIFGRPDFRSKRSFGQCHIAFPQRKPMVFLDYIGSSIFTVDTLQNIYYIEE